MASESYKNDEKNEVNVKTSRLQKAARLQKTMKLKRMQKVKVHIKKLSSGAIQQVLLIYNYFQ